MTVKSLYILSLTYSNSYSKRTEPSLLPIGIVFFLNETDVNPIFEGKVLHVISI